MKIPISSILISNRLRDDKGFLADSGMSIQALADSISRFGLFNPPIITPIPATPEGFTFRLIMGERRILACKVLEWEEIEVKIQEDLSPDELQMMELEENIRRLPMSWLEKCLGIAKVHSLQERTHAIAGTEWGQAATGELFGVTNASVSYAIKIADELDRDKESPIRKMDSMNAALDYLLKKKEDEVLAELARRQQAAAIEYALRSNLGNEEHFNIETFPEEPPPSDAIKEEAKEKYLRNPHNDPEQFELYWEEKNKASAERQRTVMISNRLIKGDCRDYMAKNEGLFDHIITDPPYLLDLDEFTKDEAADQGTLKNVESILEEHSVEKGRAFMETFLPLAWSSTKDRAFVAVWMNWEYSNEVCLLAKKIGFRVQAWPFVWCKNVGGNNAAEYNMTKKAEFCLLFRKPGAVLAETCSTNWIATGADEFRKTMKHPFVKPFLVWEFLIDHLTHIGEKVLEPCAGEGSNVISLIRKNRDYIACESNEGHYNRLVENIKNELRKRNPDYLFV